MTLISHLSSTGTHNGGDSDNDDADLPAPSKILERLLEQGASSEEAGRALGVKRCDHLVSGAGGTLGTLREPAWENDQRHVPRVPGVQLRPHTQP